MRGEVGDGGVVEHEALILMGVRVLGGHVAGEELRGDETGAGRLGEGGGWSNEVEEKVEEEEKRER